MSLESIFLKLPLPVKKIAIFIIGGVVDGKINGGRLQQLFENAEIVYAETKELKNKIKKKSSAINVRYLPNFKEIPDIEVPERDLTNKISVLYLSRIHRDKRIFGSIQVVKRLNEIDSQRKYILDVYGNIDLSNEDLQLFDQQVRKCDYINYKGFIDLNQTKAYMKLAEYHFFLFLTKHPGEGFPGVLIDAMIAQVPVVASDWKYNTEILSDGNGILGDIIDLDDRYIEKVSESILILIDDKGKYKKNTGENGKRSSKI